jgi:UDP-2,4-diacetamido-2,4,6-trideoxy-beta-L-altropyranose hydrolase
MIFFRLDGTRELGMGHTFRCISLAKELSANNNIIFFIEKSDKAKEVVTSNGFVVACPLDFEDYLRMKDGKNIVITDLIELKATEEWLEVIKSMDEVIHVGIHDLGLNQFDSDLIIDGSVVNIKSYGKKKSASYYLGKEYMILNSTFEKLHNEQKAYPDKVSNILLCFGGSDPSNITERVISDLAGNFQGIKFLVVFGPEKESMEVILGEHQNIHILKGLKDISGMLKRCDLIISSGGIILYEAACVGTPSISICYDKNQGETAYYFQKAGVSINLGEFKKLKIEDLIGKLKELIDDKKKREKMGNKGKELIDGRGVYRVKEVIKTLLN